MSSSKKLETIVATFWLCVDAVFLTVVISMMSSPTFPPGPMLIGYPMLVVGGRMFFRARMAVLVTIVSMLSYIALLVLNPYLLSNAFQHATFLLIFGLRWNLLPTPSPSFSKVKQVCRDSTGTFALTPHVFFLFRNLSRRVLLVGKADWISVVLLGTCNHRTLGPVVEIKMQFFDTK